MHTLDQPAHFGLTGVKCALNPFILPRKELDEFDLDQHINDHVWCNYQVENRRTDPINSLTTCILLSLATETPFWILMARFMMNELSGQPANSTRYPAKADHPRSLWKRSKQVHLKSDHNAWLVQEYSGNDYFEWRCLVVSHWRFHVKGTHTAIKKGKSRKYHRNLYIGSTFRTVEGDIERTQ